MNRECVIRDFYKRNSALIAAYKIEIALEWSFEQQPLISTQAALCKTFVYILYDIY